MDRKLNLSRKTKKTFISNKKMKYNLNRSNRCPKYYFVR